MNDRQKRTLEVLQDYAVGRDNKQNKKFIAMALYGQYFNSNEFHSTAECRVMADDFNVINEETNHVVVSTKAGIYLADKYEARQVIEKQIKAKGAEIQRLRYKQRKINLDNQVKEELNE